MAEGHKSDTEDFPDVGPPTTPALAKAEKSIRRGAIAGSIVAVLGGLLGAVVWSGLLSEALDPGEGVWIVFSAIVLGALAFGVSRRSRCAAILLLLLYLADHLLSWADGGRPPKIVALIFVYFFARAVVGSFRYHRIRKQLDPDYTPVKRWMWWLWTPVTAVVGLLMLLGMLEASVQVWDVPGVYAAARRQTPPTLPLQAVLRPTLQMRDGPYEAGTAFAVEHDGHTLVLTAQHLFGEQGGMERELDHRESRLAFVDAWFAHAFEGDVLATSDRLLPLDEDAGDVAVFAVDAAASRGLHPLRLASRLPVAGETVWLLAQAFGDVPFERTLHQAVALGDDGFDWGFVYLDQGIDLIATSGAAVLDASGAVVAVNIGALEYDGRLVGVGHPVAEFLEPLDAALARTSR